MNWAKNLFRKENVFSPNEAYDVAPFEDKEDVANKPMFVKVSDLRSWFLKKDKEIKKDLNGLMPMSRAYKSEEDIEQARAFREIVEECKKQKERR